MNNDKEYQMLPNNAHATDQYYWNDGQIIVADWYQNRPHLAVFPITGTVADQAMLDEALSEAQIQIDNFKPYFKDTNHSESEIARGFLFASQITQYKRLQCRGTYIKYQLDSILFSIANLFINCSNYLSNAQLIHQTNVIRMHLKYLSNN